MSPYAILVSGFACLVGAVVTALAAQFADRRYHLVDVTALLLWLGAVIFFWHAGSSQVLSVGSVFLAGAYFSLMIGLIALLGALAITALPQAPDAPGVALLMVLAAAGALVASVSVDALLTLVGIEVAGACGYALVAYLRSPRALESAMKYFVQGALATGLFVLGLFVLLATLGSGTSYQSIYGALAVGLVDARGALVLAGLALVMAFLVKLAAAPVHSWAPDAYENTSPVAAGFLSSLVKFGLFSALAHAVAVLLAVTPGATSLTANPIALALAIAAAVSILLGSAVALVTASYRRMLGYAGVAQVGYALVAYCLGSSTAAVNFAAAYALASVVTFFAAERYSALRPSWDGTVNGLAGLGSRDKGLLVAQVLALASLVGIPPLFGFWAKYGVLYAAVLAAFEPGTPHLVAGGWVPLTLVAIALLGSLMSLGYYGNVIRVLIFTGTTHTSDDEATLVQRTDGQTSGRRARASALIAAAILAIYGLNSLLPGLLGLVKNLL